MTKLAHGRVRGRTIELSEDLGLADGQEVEVRVTVAPNVEKRGAIPRTAGALAEDPYWDNIMEEVHQSRTNDRPVQAEIE